MDNADPTPLGLAGFSSVVLMVSLYYSNILPNLDFIAPLSFIAGLTLLMSSTQHFNKQHTFPATTFGIYGSFWLSISIYIFAGLGDFTNVMKFIRIPLAIFTLYAWAVSIFISKASFVIFSTLEVKLVCFVVGELIASRVIMIVGGCFGVVCACTGYYVSAALLLKPYIQLPLGKPLVENRTVITT